MGKISIEALQAVLSFIETNGEERLLELIQQGQPKSKICIFLDAGHGGISPSGQYMTKGKFFKHPDFTFYEGVFNRKVCDELQARLSELNVASLKVYHDFIDTDLATRVKLANSAAKYYEKTIYISVHGNAGPATARGVEVYTSKGETESDKFAEILIEKLAAKVGKIRKDTTDGDSDREANFYVLRNTKMPAILSENGFFTNYEEAKLMLTDAYIKDIAAAHFDAIKEYFNL